MPNIRSRVPKPGNAGTSESSITRPTCALSKILHTDEYHGRVLQSKDHSYSTYSKVVKWLYTNLLSSK
eukprot:11817470-Prorocentrum_lima.AAC.1